MATEFAILLPGEAKQATELALNALELLDDIEQRLSIFNPESEVCCLNAAAGKRAVKVSPLVMDVLEKSLRWSEQTGGAFDVTTGPLVESWGFLRRRGKKPSDTDIEQAVRLVGYQKLRLDKEKQTAELTEAGMQVNLGAIGKGFAVDRIAAYLRQNGVDHFLVHGGKSTIIASQPADAEQADPEIRPWKVGVEHPLRPTVRVDELHIRTQAVATSSSGKQFFHHRGKRFGHVIDPRNGQPAGDWLSLTLVCDNATEADALSTAYYVLGLEATRSLFTTPDGAAGTSIKNAIGIRAAAQGDWKVERW